MTTDMNMSWSPLESIYTKDMQNPMMQSWIFHTPLRNNGMFGKPELFLTKEKKNKRASVAQPLPTWMLDLNETLGTSWFTFWKQFGMDGMIQNTAYNIIYNNSCYFSWDDVILAQILLKSVLTFIREQLAPCRQQAHHPCILGSKIVLKFSLLPLQCFPKWSMRSW